MPTAVVERVGRNKVNAPSEPENIGNWTPQYIESCIYNKETKSISQELIKTVNSLIPTKKLVDLGNRLLDDYDDKGKIKKNSKIAQFTIEIGSTEQHENNFLDESVESDSNFKNAISNHYKSVFNAEENKFIDEVLDSKDIFHVVVWCKYYSNNQNKTKKMPLQIKSKIAAAATFKFGSYSCLLNYIGVLLEEIPSNKMLSEEHVPRKRKKDKSDFRSSDIGLLLICMIQKLSFIKIKKHHIVCQANKNLKGGAIAFYYRMFFKVINKKSQILLEHQTKSQDLIHEARELYWVRSRCPLYLIHPYWLNKEKNADSIRVAIELGKKNILKIPSEPTITKKYRTNVKELTGYLNNFKFTTEIESDENNKSNEDMKASLPLLKEVLKKATETVSSEKVFEINEFQTDNKSIDNQMYITMSNILYFRPKNRQQDVRAFLYYVLFCITSLSNDSVYRREILNEIRSDVINCVLLLENTMSSTKFKDYHRFLGKDDDPHQAANESQILNDIHQISRLQLLENYKGSLFEWKIFTSIFLKKVFVVSASAKTSDSENWSVSVDDNLILPYTTISQQKSQNIIFLAMDNDNKFHIISEENTVNEEMLEENEEVVAWLNKRDKKLFPTLNEGLEIDRTRRINKMFELQEICNDVIEHKFRIIITKILDPIESWFQKTIPYGLLGDSTSFNDLLTLRPDTLTTSSVLDAYMEVLNAESTNGVLLIGPGMVETFSQKEKTKQKIATKISKAKYIMILSNYGSMHWIVYHFPNPTTKQETLEIFVADSLNNAESSNPTFNFATQYSLVHFLCYFFIKEEIN
jgi:hypothetical protein